MSQDAIPTATVVSVGPPAASLEGAKRAASKLKVTDSPTYEELLKIRDDVVLAPESLDLDPVGASADELARVAELRCAAQFRAIRRNFGATSHHSSATGRRSSRCRASARRRPTWRTTLTARRCCASCARGRRSPSRRRCSWRCARGTASTSRSSRRTCTATRCARARAPRRGWRTRTCRRASTASTSAGCRCTTAGTASTTLRASRARRPSRC